MPRGDGAGPLGRGPLSVWGRGFCATVATARAGFGLGRTGRARGYRGGTGWAEPARSEDIREQVDQLKAEINRLEGRLR